MYWVPAENHAAGQLSKSSRNVFSSIRRDPERRHAQIQWWNDVPSVAEWVDLINYRYGMSVEEEAYDILHTGIERDVWRSKIRELMASEYHGVRHRKLV